MRVTIPDALVVCSLEAWDQVWRRNQFLSDVLLRRHPSLRVLFVEPPADPLFDVLNGRRPTFPRLRRVGYEGRLHALRPVKIVPRRLGSLADEALRLQVRSGVRMLGYANPTLWINDVTYAPLIARTRWPSLYDVTDDWLTAPFVDREVDRLAALEAVALEDADTVVVCSTALAATRGRTRPVKLVPNAVDSAHFTRPQERPLDLPRSPVVVYVGSLHESRLDVGLVVDLARRLARVNVALVGPDSLGAESRRRLAMPNVFVLGPRPYEQVPAYLQHADVIVVPHLVNEFTESLDPIKAYECLAVATPTVATPVAGFRELDRAVVIAERDSFARAVESVVDSGHSERLASTPPTWEERATEFEDVLAELPLRRRRERP
jgi:teichuronic acid biosynthesis glycosyltransferase TuaH